MKIIAATLIALPGLIAVPCSAQVRAAGMALRDGALPPGTLTVRVVRGDFSNNLPNQTVSLEVDGGPVQRAITARDGRATFAHLPIGARVRAFATVDNEALESEAFEIVGESGIRIVLIANGDSGGAADRPLPPSHPAVPASLPTLTAPPAVTLAGTPVQTLAAASSSRDLVTIRLVWLVLTLAMTMYVTRRWWMPRQQSRTTDAACGE
jgi:hypothetical protein